MWRRGGHAKMLQPPTLFGHEAVGQIVAIGDGVTDWQMGDRVVANNSAPCMKCFFCQRQEYSLCPNLTWNNGAFAEYLKIPAPIVQHNLLPIPTVLPSDTPLRYALRDQAIRLLIRLAKSQVEHLQ